MAGAQFSPVQTEVFQLKGGLDLVSPPLAMAPGSLIDSINFEPSLNGGYTRMRGIERLDGRPAPSAAAYWTLGCTITGAVAVGDTVTGLSSSKTAVVLKINGANELIVAKLSGTLTHGEALQVGGVTQATFDTATLNGALTPALHATYKYLASNAARADITLVPGAGPVRGVWHYNGDIYAFRDYLTDCRMYKATSTGWVRQTFGTELQFIAVTAGTGVAIVEGNTVTGATSGATGVVKRVLLRTGLWNNAPVGTLVFDTITGTFATGETLNVAGTARCKADGASTAIALLAGGRFEFLNSNFSGSATTQRMYFCDGVNLAHEWDGTRLVPIRTGIIPDAPKYLASWKNMLVMAVSSSVQLSGTSAPYSWTALTGAAEIALGDVVTGLNPQTGDANTGVMVITTKSSTYLLYGTSAGDLRLVLHSPDAGAAPWTTQNIGVAYYLDPKGIVSLTTTQSFGNFALATLSRQIQPLIDAKRGLAVASCVVRVSNQYRLFFSDGSGLILYMNGAELGGFMAFDYGSAQHMNAVVSFIDSTGAERMLAAGSDGYVYELDKGTSFDGGTILARLFLAFNSSKSPRMHKRYRRAVLQATCQNTADVRVGYELNYGSSSTDAGLRAQQTLLGAGGYWDAMLWEAFNWDSPYLTEYTIDTPGNGQNMGLLIYGDSAVNDSFTVSSCILHYLFGRNER